MTTKINVKNDVYVSVSHIVIICDRRISQTLQNKVAFKKIKIFFFILFSFTLSSSIHAHCSRCKCILQRMRIRMPYILSALYSFEFCNRSRIPIRIKEKNCSTKCDIKTVKMCVWTKKRFYYMNINTSHIFCRNFQLFQMFLFFRRLFFPERRENCDKASALPYEFDSVKEILGNT